MAKSKRLNINSVDYIDLNNQKNNSTIKNNLKQFSKNNWKILFVFLGFFLMFILGLVLTPIGLVLRPNVGDLGGTDIYSTIACLGIISLLISSLGVILVIPITYRFLKKRKQIKNSAKSMSSF